MGYNIIKEKSFSFAVDVVKLYWVLVKEKNEYTLSKQMLRSGTSIGANVREGIRGISKSDFRFKMSIALKEANETEYWLELMMTSGVVSEQEIHKLLIECKELCKLLFSVVRTCDKDINYDHRIHEDSYESYLNEFI